MMLTLYIADRRKNKMMRAFDLCPDYKVFTSPAEEKIERKDIDPDEEFIRRLITLSTLQKDFWISAAHHDGTLYAAPGIREISDGQRIWFV